MYFASYITLKKKLLQPSQWIIKRNLQWFVSLHFAFLFPCSKCKKHPSQMWTSWNAIPLAQICKEFKAFLWITITKVKAMKKSRERSKTRQGNEQWCWSRSSTITLSSADVFIHPWLPLGELRPPETSLSPPFQFDSYVNADSFGFVAIAILISMFLVMAICERFLRANCWKCRQNAIKTLNPHSVFI